MKHETKRAIAYCTVASLAGLPLIFLYTVIFESPLTQVISGITGIGFGLLAHKFYASHN